MFKAVIQGKSGSVRSDIEIDNPEAKRVGLEMTAVREDILTAAIFSRLSYLPAKKFWQILCKLYPELPSRELVTLKNIEFWPYWEHPDEERRSVEPDVFLQFEIGDPKVSVDLLVEVKRFENWTPQSFEQHIDQISGYFSNMGEAFEAGSSLYFLALGGLGNQPEAQIRRLKSHVMKGVKNCDKGEFSKSHIGGTSWKRLTSVIARFIVEWDDKNRLLLNDLIEILNYAGFANRQYFADPDPLKIFQYNTSLLSTLYEKAV